jgi:hypothetical protein
MDITFEILCQIINLIIVRAGHPSFITLRHCGGMSLRGRKMLRGTGLVNLFGERFGRISRYVIGYA